MNKRLDLIGNKYFQLTFTKFAHIKNQKTYWEAECTCGNTCIVEGSRPPKSCGCFDRKIKAKNGRRNKNRQTPIDFIKSRIKIDNKTGCWNWTKSLLKGYARFNNHRAKKSSLVSRYVYEYIKGTDPKDKQVCHVCDNPKCVNPDHLFLGTVIDNLKDMKEKGRDRRVGEQNGRSKLTKEEVIQIRKLKRKLTQAEIAELFNVSRSTIGRILNKTIWSRI